MCGAFMKWISWLPLRWPWVIFSVGWYQESQCCWQGDDYKTGKYKLDWFEIVPNLIPDTRSVQKIHRPMSQYKIYFIYKLHFSVPALQSTLLTVFPLLETVPERFFCNDIQLLWLVNHKKSSSSQRYVEYWEQREVTRRCQLSRVGWSWRNNLNTGK